MDSATCRSVCRSHHAPRGRTQHVPTRAWRQLDPAAWSVPRVTGVEDWASSGTMIVPHADICSAAEETFHMHASPSERGRRFSDSRQVISSPRLCGGLQAKSMWYFGHVSTLDLTACPASPPPPPLRASPASLSSSCHRMAWRHMQVSQRKSNAYAIILRLGQMTSCVHDCRLTTRGPTTAVRESSRNSFDSCVESKVVFLLNEGLHIRAGSDTRTLISSSCDTPRRPIFGRSSGIRTENRTL